MHLELEARHLGEMTGEPVPGPSGTLALHEQPRLLFFCPGSEERQDIEEEPEYLVALKSPCFVWLMAGILGNHLPKQSWPPLLKEGNDFKVGVAQTNDAARIPSAANSGGALALKHSCCPSEICNGPAWATIDLRFKLCHLCGGEMCAIPAHVDAKEVLAPGWVFVGHNGKYSAFLAHIVNPAGITVYQAIQNASDGSRLLPPLPTAEAR